MASGLMAVLSCVVLGCIKSQNESQTLKETQNGNQRLHTSRSHWDWTQDLSTLSLVSYQLSYEHLLWIYLILYHFIPAPWHINSWSYQLPHGWVWPGDPHTIQDFIFQEDLLLLIKNQWSSIEYVFTFFINKWFV